MRVRGEVEVKRREAVFTLTECRVDLLLVTVLVLLPKKKGRINSRISYWASSCSLSLPTSYTFLKRQRPN